MNKLGIIAGIVASTIAVAAAQENAPVNACDYLNADEVTAVVGFPVDAGERHDEGYVGGPRDPDGGTYSSTCLWRVSADRGANNPEAPLGGARFVILNVMSWPDEAAAGSFLRSFHDAAADHVIPMKPVVLEIGDESLWWGDGVAVRKGHVSFGVSVRLIGLKVEERAMQERLAARIVARI
ncbi:MAG: hypothetical protein KDE14_02870 [Rhodobacteraceae bacterium]|nr:hypothetical protein [Paracoccaceae bacterium]